MLSPTYAPSRDSGSVTRADLADAVLRRIGLSRAESADIVDAVLTQIIDVTMLPTQRDLHVLAVDELGRMNWQKASGYNTRSKVEAAISRYKRVIGDALKSRHDARRATEVAIAFKSLNRMNELGRAKFVRMA